MATENQTEPVEAIKAEPTVIDINTMTTEQRLAVLRSVHGYFASYDRVPGNQASIWGQNLDALGFVINSITKELSNKAQETAQKKLSVKQK